MLDFLQSMSNTAADTVAGPVDLIAAILKKAGVDVGTPVGGSDWMTQKGLRRPVPQSAASLAGETFGLLSPVVAAAKAPQIAGGLLKMGENAAAPRTLNPQTGAIVWHGSPHKFDKFDSSKIGTGEGAQAYGHGLYLATAPEVAQTYRRTAQSAPDRLFSIAKSSGVSDEAADTLSRYYHEARSRASLDDVLATWRQPHPSPAVTQFRTKLLAEEPAIRAAWQEFTDPGSLYKVDLPDSAIARMLDWDKPLSQQAPEVQKALAALDPEQYAAHADDFDPMEVGQMIYQRLMNQGRDYAITAGRNAQTTLPMAQAKAADDLRAFGIPGIRYLDGGSRGAGSGTSNFVVFPGEENILTILERNGIRVGN